MSPRRNTRFLGVESSKKWLPVLSLAGLLALVPSCAAPVSPGASLGVPGAKTSSDAGSWFVEHVLIPTPAGCGELTEWACMAAALELMTPPASESEPRVHLVRATAEQKTAPATTQQPRRAVIRRLHIDPASVQMRPVARLVAANQNRGFLLRIVGSSLKRQPWIGFLASAADVFAELCAEGCGLEATPEAQAAGELRVPEWIETPIDSQCFDDYQEAEGPAVGVFQAALACLEVSGYFALKPTGGPAGPDVEFVPAPGAEPTATHSFTKPAHKELVLLELTICLEDGTCFGIRGDAFREWLESEAAAPTLLAESERTLLSTTLSESKPTVAQVQKDTQPFLLSDDELDGLEIERRLLEGTLKKTGFQLLEQDAELPKVPDKWWDARLASRHRSIGFESRAGRYWWSYPEGRSWEVPRALGRYLSSRFASAKRIGVDVSRPTGRDHARMHGKDESNLAYVFFHDHWGNAQGTVTVLRRVRGAPTRAVVWRTGDHAGEFATIQELKKHGFEEEPPHWLLPPDPELFGLIDLPSQTFAIAPWIVHSPAATDQGRIILLQSFEVDPLAYLPPPRGE